MHTKRKKIKSYLLGDQVSALSDKIGKLFKNICKFGPLIGPLSSKMTKKGQICTKQNNIKSYLLGACVSAFY